MSRILSRFAAVGLYLGLFGVGAALAQDASVTTLDKEGLKAREVSMVVEGGDLMISFVDGAARKKIKASEALYLQFQEPRKDAQPAAPEDLRLNLTNGDVLFGKAGKPAQEDAMEIQSKTLGTVIVKFEHISSVRFLGTKTNTATARPEKPDEDIVVTATGDHGRGTLKSIDKDGIVYYSKDFKRDIKRELKAVAAAWLFSM
jgi:hypothetical protein